MVQYTFDGSGKSSEDKVAKFAIAILRIDLRRRGRWRARGKLWHILLWNVEVPRKKAFERLQRIINLKLLMSAANLPHGHRQIRYACQERHKKDIDPLHSIMLECKLA